MGKIIAKMGLTIMLKRDKDLPLYLAILRWVLAVSGSVVALNWACVYVYESWLR